MPQGDWLLCWAIDREDQCRAVDAPEWWASQGQCEARVARCYNLRHSVRQNACLQGPCPPYAGVRRLYATEGAY